MPRVVMAMASFTVVQKDLGDERPWMASWSPVQRRQQLRPGPMISARLADLHSALTMSASYLYSITAYEGAISVISHVGHLGSVWLV